MFTLTSFFIGFLYLTVFFVVLAVLEKIFKNNNQFKKVLNWFEKL